MVDVNSGIMIAEQSVRGRFNSPCPPINSSSYCSDSTRYSTSGSMLRARITASSLTIILNGNKCTYRLLRRPWSWNEDTPSTAQEFQASMDVRLTCEADAEAAAGRNCLFESTTHA